MKDKWITRKIHVEWCIFMGPGPGPYMHTIGWQPMNWIMYIMQTVSPLFAPKMHACVVFAITTNCRAKKKPRTEFQHQITRSEQNLTKWFTWEIIPPNKRLTCQKTANTELLEVAAQPSWEMPNAAWPADRPSKKAENATLQGVNKTASRGASRWQIQHAAGTLG